MSHPFYFDLENMEDWECRTCKTHEYGVNGSALHGYLPNSIGTPTYNYIFCSVKCREEYQEDHPEIENVWHHLTDSDSIKICKYCR